MLTAGVETKSSLENQTSFFAKSESPCLLTVVFGMVARLVTAAPGQTARIGTRKLDGTERVTSM